MLSALTAVSDLGFLGEVTLNSRSVVLLYVVRRKMYITSAAGIISLLEEPMPELKVFALKKLDDIVDEFWPEISEAIEKIEILHEDKNFNQHELAALVASKVYYHLGSFEDSLTYALGAGNLFDVNARTEYVDTTIAKCIDYYTQLRCAKVENPNEAKDIDPRLEAIVDRMFLRCLSDGQYRQALGLALETRRMDIFERAIHESDDVNAMLSYAFQVAMSLIQNRGFRNEVLRSLVGLYRNLATPDYVNMCQCLIFLDDPLAVAQVLEKLSKDTEDSTLMAYQIAFDLYESATQQFLGRVLQALPSYPAATTVVAVLDRQTSSSERCEQSDASKPIHPPQAIMVETALSATPTTPVISDVKPEPVLFVTEEDKRQQERVEKLASILSGKVTIDLHLQFLIRSNHSDMLILKNTKDAIRVSICHTATVIANAFMHSGTTSDQFLRDNLEWLARATNWAKMTATASLGVIHRGHEQEALALMQSYLPKEVGPSSGYSEGGGLYALGLIHANHGGHIIDYLLQQLKDAQNEMVRHGGCLGLGLAAMGTNRQDVYEQLKFNLYQDDAVTGEAAGIAMGMVMLGSKATQAIEDMVAYAQETQHEKILRGLAVGVALTMYGRLEEADPLVATLCQDKDPILRRSGMYTLAMAYCGTGNNQAIRRLLHVAVSDVNDDVRRAAVTGIGFLLFRTPEQCPSVVSLLAESYNPHVRYGAAMALGVACAGTGLKEAIALLEPMTNDPVNFVRQGALVASAMILVQQTEHTCPKNGNQHAEEQQQQLQFQHLMTSIGVGPMKRPVPFSAAYPPQPHMMDFHGEALPHRQIIHFPPQVLMQSLSPESQMTPLSAKQYQHKFHMHHGYAATASPAPTNRQPSHDFPLLQHQHQAQHEHPLQQISGDESGACIFPSCDGGWGQGIAPRMEINQASGIVVPVAKQNVDINCSPVKNTPKPEMSTVAVVTSGVSGDSSKSTQAVYEKSMEDPGMVLKRRFAARLAGLNAMHVRRQRLEQEVTAALERQQASLIRSQELDERLERQNDAWKRARQREAVAARELTTAREELHSLRSWLKMKSETFEEEVESYGKELRKIIEKARVAPEIHETERLKEVLEILQKEQAQQEVELGELDVGLQNAKKEYTEILTQDKNFSVCSEEDITTAIMMLVEEANQTVAEQGEESHRLLELEKNLLVERDVILREKEQRERPLRAIFTRATDVSATIANPMTVPVSSTSHIHSTARLAKIPGQE